MHTSDNSNATPMAPGEPSDFRLTLSGMRRDLDQDSNPEYTSEGSSDSSQRTTLESPEQPLHPTNDLRPSSQLDVDRTSLRISQHSSLDVRIDFATDAEGDAAEALPSAEPPIAPWLAWLNSEINDTHKDVTAGSWEWDSDDEYYAFTILIVIRSYLSQDVVEGAAKFTAAKLYHFNDEYLSDQSTWKRFEKQEDMEGFLWMVWCALLEIAVRMDCRGDSQDAIVLLVKELLLRPRVKLPVVYGVSLPVRGTFLFAFRC